MLAQTGTLPADETGWSFEFKWDGVRALAYVEERNLVLRARSNADITSSYPEAAELLGVLQGRQAILDGEIVAIDERGIPSFSLLQQRIHVRDGSRVASLQTRVPVSFLIFDVCFLDGKSLLDRPYRERRATLEGLGIAGEHLAVPPRADPPGKNAVQVSKEIGLEGIIAKRDNSAYAPGKRNGAWVKIKNFRTQEVVVGGYTLGEGRRAKQLGALLLGVYDDGGHLRYVGRVGTGFSDEMLDEMRRALDPITVERSPFEDGLTARERLGARFVEPVIVGEVEFIEWTPTKRLRAPSWRGLRIDKAPSEVRRES